MVRTRSGGAGYAGYDVSRLLGVRRRDLRHEVREGHHAQSASQGAENSKGCDALGLVLRLLVLKVLGQVPVLVLDS